MKVNRIMPITGVIAGLCASTKASALEKVGGVMSVEEEVVASLPPPDSALQ
jgi:copper chaperone CopZ